MSDGSAPVINRYEWDEVPPSVTVVETVSDATGVNAIELPTLNDTIDTDALDSLFNGVTRGTEGLTVSFVYADCEVTVLADGTVIVDPSNTDE